MIRFSCEFRTDYRGLGIPDFNQLWTMNSTNDGELTMAVPFDLTVDDLEKAFKKFIEAVRKEEDRIALLKS